MAKEHIIDKCERIWKSSTNFDEEQQEMIRLARLGLEADQAPPLRCSHGPYRIQGTTGCQNCEEGRVTLYYLKDLCSSCELLKAAGDA